jgi:hypothetical protein
MGSEPGHEPGKGPAGRNGTGGWTTESVGKRVEGSVSEVEGGVVVVEKGKTVSSNTT